MEESFNPKECIKFLGDELIHEFMKAGMTTHTHAAKVATNTIIIEDGLNRPQLFRHLQFLSS